MIFRTPVLAVLLTLPLLTACGESQPEADFRFISGAAHKTLDPQKMSWGNDFRIAREIYEPLLELDYADGSISPAVAERYTVSDDGLTYTFHLRDDARWSNGDPVTSQDFIYAWQRAMLPDSAADYYELFSHIQGAQDFYDYRAQALKEFATIRAQSGGGSDTDAAEAAFDLAMDYFADHVGIDAPDERTLIVTLNHPTPFFPQLVAFTTFAPVHRASVEAASSFSPDTGMKGIDTTYWSDPVTNGPYFIAERAFKRHVLLQQNPHYWNKANMKNTSVLELIVPEVQTAILKYQSGEADAFLEMPSSEPAVASLVQQQLPYVHTQQVAGTYFYNFNCMPTFKDGRDNPLHDPRVRRALAMAVDRDAIVSTVTRLNQPTTKTFIPVGALPGYEPPTDAGVDFDPEAARQLLAEAGHANGQGLDGLSILYATGLGHTEIAQAIKGMWQQHLNVNVALDGVESGPFSTRLKQQEYSIGRASWIGDYPDPTSWLDKMTSTSGNNDCKWTNAEYDRLIEAAGQENDAQKRLQMLRDAEAILLQEQPMAMIYQYVMVYLWDPDKVQGLKSNDWDRWDLDQVSVVKPQ